MIRVEEVAKYFTAKDRTVRAVDGASFVCKPGEIYGLLGPNGAGKTTTLRMISTLLRPTRGRIKVMGFDTVERGDEVRARLGFLTSDMKLPHNFTPRELMRFFGRLNRVPAADLEARSARLSERLGLGPHLDTIVDKLSTGNAQKAAIAIALVHDPPVIVFDEPTNGLDIMTARAVLSHLRAERGREKTVVISTHNMPMAAKLCDRVGILIGGRLVAEGPVREVVAGTGRPDLEEAFFALAGEAGAAESAGGGPRG